MSTTPQHSGNRMERLDALLKQVEHFKDEQSARTTREIVHLIMDLHGSALERILDIIAPRHRELIDELAQDELIGNLLVLYGLHPLDTETRIRQAITNANSDAQLLDIRDGVARIRIHGDFPPREAVEQAIYDAVSDITGIEIVTDASPVASARRPLPILAS